MASSSSSSDVAVVTDAGGERGLLGLAFHPELDLAYVHYNDNDGDTVLAVGTLENIQKVAAELGDSPKSLNYPHLIPVFLGIALGIVVGSWPFSPRSWAPETRLSIRSPVIRRTGRWRRGSAPGGSGGPRSTVP